MTRELLKNATAEVFQKYLEHCIIEEKKHETLIALNIEQKPNRFTLFLQVLAFKILPSIVNR